jgi:hypothetical protein
MRKLLPLLLIFCCTASASLQTLHSSLDPLSVSEHLAFYELYPETAEGQKALKAAWQLLTRGEEQQSDLHLPRMHVQALVSLITRQPSDPPVKLSDEQLSLIEKLAAPLANRKLRGHSLWSQEEVLKIDSKDLDLARGLLLFQLTDRAEIRQYEASLDLMALQILARVPKGASARQKISAINNFIFHEMGFRFPPHSLYAKDIDLYTFLPSVLDSRQGVCLGVSILYLSLAQRIDLPLEIVTPPGHIYVRYNDGKEILNIETTARGIHIPSENYLGVDTRKLEMRTLKEVIGLAFFNQASVAWAKNDYAMTVTLYEKARPFLSDDPLLKMFLGFNYLFIGKKGEGKKLLKEIQNIPFDYAVSTESIPDDYLRGKIDADGIKAVFAHIDETRASIQEKQKKLHEVIKRYPHFRAGLFHLAITYLQLGRGSEGLVYLQRHHRLDASNATLCYYLSVLSIQRLDHNRAWNYLKHAETLAVARGHSPKALKELRHDLRRISPEN